MQAKLSGSEAFWYYLICIFTFGGLYFTKLAAKKALCEVNAEMKAQRYHHGPPVGTPS